MRYQSSKVKAIGIGALVAFATACSPASPPLADPSGMPLPAADPPGASSPAQTSGPDLSACLLTPEEVAKAFGASDVVIDPAESGGGWCTYALPEGSLQQQKSGDSVVAPGGGSAGIQVEVLPYADNIIKTVVISEYGGTTPEAVFTSASRVYAAQAKKDGDSEHFLSDPTIGKGLVSNGLSDAVLAGPGENWYRMNIINMKTNEEYGPAFIELGKLLLGKEE